MKSAEEFLKMVAESHKHRMASTPFHEDLELVIDAMEEYAQYKVNELNKSDVIGALPSFIEFKAEYERRNKEFSHTTMKPIESYMIGFAQCYSWIKRKMKEGNDL